MAKFETDIWPYIAAKWQTPIAVPRQVRLVVIHCMEAPEKETTAENVGLFFQRGESRASAHVGVDNNSVVQYVKDNNVAWAAPGVNHDGIHLELAGYSAQNPQSWHDEYSTKMLELAANVCAQYCRKYAIPVIQLSNDALKAGVAGIIGHYQATAVYKPNQGHADPGRNFPWDLFISRVREYYANRKPTA